MNACAFLLDVTWLTKRFRYWIQIQILDILSAVPAVSTGFRFLLTSNSVVYHGIDRPPH